jgi:hypothetical protein
MAQSLEQLRKNLRKPITPGKKRCYFVVDEGHTTSYMDLVDLVCRIDSDAQRIFVFTKEHSFPMWQDVDRWETILKDKNQVDVAFYPQTIRPIVFTYGHIWPEKKFQGQKDDGSMWLFVLKILMFVFWFALIQLK